LGLDFEPAHFPKLISRIKGMYRGHKLALTGTKGGAKIILRLLRPPKLSTKIYFDKKVKALGLETVDLMKNLR
jgi:predicted solute-binding protein